MREAAIILDLTLAFAGVVGLALAFYLFVVTIVGFFARLTARDVPANTRVAIIIPAFNESLLIERTIRSIQASDYPARLFDIIVIADNCTDDTAEIAEAMGVKCLKRSDEKKRGKGYALQWAFEYATKKRWDYGAYLVIDADSLVSKNLLKKVNDYMGSGLEAVTCFHMVQGRESSPSLDIIRMGFTLRNLRNAGLATLGGSAPLLGSGMCFSRKLVERFGWSSFSITEDREEWAFLYSEGLKVGYIPDAKVLSEMPGAVKDLENPRARWDIGQIHIITRFFRSFFSRLIGEKNLGSLLTLFELITPPFTLLFFFMILATAVALLLRNLISGYTVALWVLNLSLMASSILAGLLRMKASPRSYLNLFVFPFVLIPWRVFNLLRGAFRKREWRRTAREAPSGKEVK